jgi:trehalose synthase
VQLLKDAALRKRLGQAARETVRQWFLMIRLLEQYLDLYNSFETVYWLKRSPDELSRCPS